MEPASGRDSQVRVGFAPEEVTVTNWPLRQEGWRAWGLLAALAGLVVFLARQTESWALTTAVGIALIAITWRLWLPVRFEFRRYGIVQVVLGRRTRIPWTSIAGYRSLPTGVLLLPEGDERPISPLQGLFIEWGGSQEPILASLDYYLGPIVSNHNSTATAPANPENFEAPPS